MQQKVLRSLSGAVAAALLLVAATSWAAEISSSITVPLPNVKANGVLDFTHETLAKFNYVITGKNVKGLAKGKVKNASHKSVTFTSNVNHIIGNVIITSTVYKVSGDGSATLSAKGTVK